MFRVSPWSLDLGILVWSFLLQAPSLMATMWGGSLSWPRFPDQQLRLAGWSLTGLCFHFAILEMGWKLISISIFHRSLMSFLFLLPVPSASASTLGTPWYILGWWVGTASHPHGWSWVPPLLSFALCLALVWRCLRLPRLRILLVLAQGRRQDG